MRRSHAQIHGSDPQTSRHERCRISELPGKHSRATREKLPGLRRYVQNFPQEDAERNRSAWDAIVELYFVDRQSMEAAWASAEGAASDADLPLFVDLAHTTWSAVEELTVFDSRL
ncbi:MAG: EthD domain-containing protein [Candidatus Sulfotelmatobacter sp.]